MKFFVAFAALVAVAVAVPLKPTFSTIAELEAIVAAINSPSTDPATAALLEQQLQDILNEVNPIAVGPAIIEEPTYEPISIEPEIIDFPLPESAITDTPSAVGPAKAPLVQIILNINNAGSGRPPVEVVGAPTPCDIVPTPVQVVDTPAEVAPVEPILIGTPIIPAPAVNLPETLN